MKIFYQKSLKVKEKGRQRLDTTRLSFKKYTKLNKSLEKKMKWCSKEPLTFMIK